MQLNIRAYLSLTVSHALPRLNVATHICVDVSSLKGVRLGYSGKGSFPAWVLEECPNLSRDYAMASSWGRFLNYSLMRLCHVSETRCHRTKLKTFLKSVPQIHLKKTNKNPITKFWKISFPDPQICRPVLFVIFSIDFFYILIFFYIEFLYWFLIACKMYNFL